MFRRRKKNMSNLLYEIPIIGEIATGIKQLNEHKTTEGIQNLVIGATGLISLVGGGLLLRQAFIRGAPLVSRVLNTGFGASQLKGTLKI